MIFLDKKIAYASASLSYYMMMSFFPFLICLSEILGQLSISQSAVMEMGEGIIPRDILAVIGSYMEYVSVNRSPVILVAGIFMLITSSSAAMRSIMGTMADIQGEGRFTGLLKMVASFIFSIVLMAAVYISGLIIVTGSSFIAWLQEHFSFGHLFESWYWLRFVILFLMLFFVVWGIYVFTSPRKETSMRRMPGALLAAVLLVAVSVVFSAFISATTRYSLIYGSLTSIIILMIWLYVCGVILIMGNVCNIAWCVWAMERKAKKKRKMAQDESDDSSDGSPEGPTEKK